MRSTQWKLISQRFYLFFREYEPNERSPMNYSLSMMINCPNFTREDSHCRYQWRCMLCWQQKWPAVWCMKGINKKLQIHHGLIFKVKSKDIMWCNFREIPPVLQFFVIDTLAHSEKKDEESKCKLNSLHWCEIVSEKYIWFKTDSLVVVDMTWRTLLKQTRRWTFCFARFCVHEFLGGNTEDNEMKSGWTRKTLLLTKECYVWCTVTDKLDERPSHEVSDPGFGRQDVQEGEDWVGQAHVDAQEHLEDDVFASKPRQTLKPQRCK